MEVVHGTWLLDISCSFVACSILHDSSSADLSRTNPHSLKALWPPLDPKIDSSPQTRPDIESTTNDNPVVKMFATGSWFAKKALHHAMEVRQYNRGQDTSCATANAYSTQQKRGSSSVS